MNQAKRQARKFIKKYMRGNIDLSYAGILDILKRMGFSVIRYTHGYMDGSVEKLLDNIHKSEFAKTTNCFYYTDDRNKFVFILDGLSEDDAIGLLLHEIGHIYCDTYINRAAYENTEFQKEKSANDFMDYVIKYCNFKGSPAKRLSVVGISVLAAISLALACYSFVSNHNSTPKPSIDEPENIIAATPMPSPTIQPTMPPTSTPVVISETDVVITRTGEKYHRPDCRHVKNRSNVVHMTISEAIKAGYEPCADCRPDTN